jgi:hypothetical protein
MAEFKKIRTYPMAWGTDMLRKPFVLVIIGTG